MWKVLKTHFSDFPAQQEIAKFLLESGLSVKNGKVYCNGAEVSSTHIAKKLGVDRRAVKATVNTISSKKELKNVFENLSSTAFFKDVAKKVNAGLVEIVPEDAAAIGIVAGVTKVVADLGISVRQCITEDPEFFPEARLYVITEKPLPPTAINQLKAVKGVKSVTIY